MTHNLWIHWKIFILNFIRLPKHFFNSFGGLWYFSWWLGFAVVGNAFFVLKFVILSGILNGPKPLCSNMHEGFSKLKMLRFFSSQFESTLFWTTVLLFGLNRSFRHSFGAAGVLNYVVSIYEFFMIIFSKTRSLSSKNL